MTLRLARGWRPIFAAAVAVLAAGTDLEAAPACQGRNMMAELATGDPTAHAGVLAAAAKTENGKAIFWRVEKAGRPQSWLLGTVHLTDERVTTLSPAVRTALDGARTVVLEIADLSKEAMAAGMAKAVPMFVARSGPTLEQRLGAEDFAVVRSVLAGAGLPEQMARMVRPWVVYMLMSTPDCERQRAGAGLASLDLRLAQIAAERGIPVIGLETLDSQLAAMAAIPEAEQLELLRMSLKLRDRREDLMETMLQLYIGRDMGAVWPLNIALARKEGIADDAFRGFERELMAKRNVKMRDGLLPELTRGGVFAGVGALHLVGETGLVTLLRAEGYTVTAVE